MKHYDLSDNPQHSLRDNGTPVGLEVCPYVVDCDIVM
jgi:hypothetical protein